MRDWTSGILTLALAAGALAIRLPSLEHRPMHGDEAVHAFKFASLWQEGVYRYDPNEFHGPALYYLTLPSAWLSPARTFAQTTEFTYRIVPVLLGTLLVVLAWLVRDGLGTAAALAAALLTAISPAMVFYSRYYIHETPLVFFTMLLIAAAYRYAHGGKLPWALAAGASAGLVQATKETGVIAFAAMLAAVAICALWRRREAVWTPRPRRLKASHVALAIGAALAVSVSLYSSFFTNWQGLWDSALSYRAWTGRLGNSGDHVHPWSYYLSMLVFTGSAPGPAWSEGAILVLAAVGIGAAFSGKGLEGADRGFLRFLAVYVIGVTAIYCLVPYKTPWCMLTFLHGMILLAGVGAVAVFRAASRLPSHLRMPARALWAALLLAALLHLGRQAYLASFRFDADRRNPYAYAQPVADVVRLAMRAKEISDLAPDGPDMLIQVFSTNHYYWPLPWYLRSFNRVGYFTSMDQAPDGSIVIAMPEAQAWLERRLPGSYHVEYYGLRPGVVLMTCIRGPLWDALIRRRAQGADDVTAVQQER